MNEKVKRIIGNGLFAAALLYESLGADQVLAQESGIRPPRSITLESEQKKPFKKIPPKIGLGLLASAIVISAGMRYQERKR